MPIAVKNEKVALKDEKAVKKEKKPQKIGAGADVVANTVTTPLEEQLNGAEGMIYMASNSTNNGDSIITMTFEVGYDQSIAQDDGGKTKCLRITGRCV